MESPRRNVIGARKHSLQTAIHLHDFTNFHKNRNTDVDLVSLPLPETFFNESCYPEYEFINAWIYRCKHCFNGYLYLLRECGAMILNSVVNGRGSLKDSSLFKYFSDCKKARDEVIGKQSRILGDVRNENRLDELRKKYIE